MSFSLAHIMVLDRTPGELVQMAERTGYESVSLRLMPMGVAGEIDHRIVGDTQRLRELRATVRSSGVRVLDVELARIYTGADVRQYRPALEAGAELGAKHVLSSAWCNDKAFVVDQLARLCDLAEPMGLVINFEFVTFSGCTNLRQARDIVEEVNRWNLGLCIDTLHFDRSGVALTELESLNSDLLNYAQICDGPRVYSRDSEELIRVARGARLLPGEGGIDLAAILQRMPTVPYVVEIPNSESRRMLGDEELVRRALVRTQAYFREHGLGRTGSNYSH
ncbi:MAG: Inosose isomerase [Steroidobacteraceae bacterium]|nr:Inosose isomerase [Steroidobacteraceae bacterium]